MLNRRYAPLCLLHFRSPRFPSSRDTVVPSLPASLSFSRSPALSLHCPARRRRGGGCSPTVTAHPHSPATSREISSRPPPRGINTRPSTETTERIREFFTLSLRTHTIDARTLRRTCRSLLRLCTCFFLFLVLLVRRPKASIV